jgi:hypothetical protein
MNVKNAGKLLDLVHLLLLIRESTLVKNPLNVSNAGQPSGVSNMNSASANSYWKETL